MPGSRKTKYFQFCPSSSVLIKIAIGRGENCWLKWVFVISYGCGRSIVSPTAWFYVWLPFCDLGLGQPVPALIALASSPGSQGVSCKGFPWGVVSGHLTSCLYISCMLVMLREAHGHSGPLCDTWEGMYPFQWAPTEASPIEPNYVLRIWRLPWWVILQESEVWCGVDCGKPRDKPCHQPVTKPWSWSPHWELNLPQASEGSLKKEGWFRGRVPSFGRFPSQVRDMGSSPGRIWWWRDSSHFLKWDLHFSDPLLIMSLLSSCHYN